MTEDQLKTPRRAHLWLYACVGELRSDGRVCPPARIRRSGLQAGTGARRARQYV